MAHEIVIQESVKKMGKRSRLWSSSDVRQVLTKNLGTESVEGIFLDTSKMEEMNLSSRAFMKMYNLRLLKIYNSEVGNKCKVHLPHGLEFLSDELRYLHWDGYPLSSMPSNFQAENIVELNLAYSKIKQLWTGVQNLGSLKEINVNNSENLTTLPDLSQAKNLERLNLEYCTSLVEFPSSIRLLDKLIDLNMRRCTSLMSVPSDIKLRSLKTLNFSGCSNLRECPEIPGNIKYLNLNETAVAELPKSIGNLNGLLSLNLKDCKRLGNLPESISLLKSLTTIDLSGCSRITRLPDFSGDIRYLYLRETSIKEIPSSIGFLSRLSCLDLMNCKMLKNLPSDISKLASLEKLVLSGCSSIMKFPNVPRNIRELFLDGTTVEEIPSSIKYCSSLFELSLQNCTRFHILPSSIFDLKYLNTLNLSGCSMFESFPEISMNKVFLKYLYLDGTAIRKLPSSIKKFKNLSILELRNCKNLYILPENFSTNWGESFQYLRKLYLNDCSMFNVPHCISDLVSLEALDLSGNPFTEIPVSISKLVELQYLGLRDCHLLASLPDLPPHLTKLDADNCIELRSVSYRTITIEGNIFDFFFSNCGNLDSMARQNIMAYALTKFQLYSRRLHSQISSVVAGESSFCLLGSSIPEWFDHQREGFSMTIQLPSHWTDGEFLGFSLCAVIAFTNVYIDDSGFQVKCRYHFRNEYGNYNDLHCYFSVLYGKRTIRNMIYCETEDSGPHYLFFGYDPCVDVTKDGRFSTYREVLIEFYPEDINGHSLHCCNVINCGVSLLYAQENIFCIDTTSSQQIQNLSGCLNITQFPDISKNIRCLNLSETAIEELPSSIGYLIRLSFLNLKNCKRLKNLPCTISELTSLENLILSGCSDVTKFPKVSRNVKKLFLDGTMIEEIPSSIGYFLELDELSLQNCTRFQILPCSICKLKSLQKLNLSGCSMFEDFPEVLEVMGSLRYLYLDGAAVRQLPSPIENLKALSILEARNCSNISRLPMMSHIEHFVKIPETGFLCKLYLSDCSLNNVPDCIGCLSSLEALDLSGNSFEEIPVSINQLFELQYLGLRGCLFLRSLPELPPQLAKLDAPYCISLNSVSIDSTRAEGNIFEFFFANCNSLTSNARHNIMLYALTKFLLYAKKLRNQMPSVLAGQSSFCISGCKIPKWFGHQSEGFSTTMQLPSQWPNSEFLGFTLCAVIAFSNPRMEIRFQVKCRYHFKTEYGECSDLRCYFGGWYGRETIYELYPMFFAYDPCVDVTKGNHFSKCREVLIEFYPEDMDGYPLHSCKVIKCGVRLVYAQEKTFCRCPTIMQQITEAYSETRGGKCSDEIKMSQNSFFPYSFGCFDVIDE